MAVGVGKHIATVLHAGCVKVGDKEAISIVHKTDEGPIEGLLYVTSGAIDRTEESLLTMGLTRAELDDPQTFQDIDAVLTGKGTQYQIVVEEEEYKGKVSLKVKWVNPLVYHDRRAAATVATMFRNRRGNAYPTAQSATASTPAAPVAAKKAESDPWGDGPF